MTKPSTSTLPSINWLTVAEVAEYLRMSRMSVYRWIKSGELPATRVGRGFRIDERAVKAVLAGKLSVGRQP